LVSVGEAFTTTQFGDHSLVFVYDYYPLAKTLQQVYFSNDAPTMAPIPENVIWSYVSQIASAMKLVHSSGLAARIIDPTKILVTGENRIRLNGCGMYDMLTYDATAAAAAAAASSGGAGVGAANIAGAVGPNGGAVHSNPAAAKAAATIHHQQEDLIHFGQLVLALACAPILLQATGNPKGTVVHHLPKSIDFLSRNYSLDLKNLVMYLLSKPAEYKRIDDVITMMAPRLLQETASAYRYD
jgi:PAB-dependent poly(A)-specific ribonuclease subunit 3